MLRIALGQSGIMSHQLSIKEHETSEEFTISFPYEAYLKNIAFDDIQTLQKDRLLMRDQKGNGDLFLYYLTEKYIKVFPISINNLERKTAIGETFLNPMKGDWNRDEIYNTIGYYLLGKVASKIEEGIKKKHLSFDSQRVQDLQSRLEKHKVVLDVEETIKQKIAKNLKQKKFKYLLSRLGNKIDEYLIPISCRIKLSGKMISLSAFIIFLLALFSRKIIMIGLSCLLLVGIMVLGNTLPNCTHVEVSSNAQNSAYQTKIKLSPLTSYHETDNQDHAIKIFNLSEASDTIGACIWMEMPYAKATYFSYDSVYHKLNKLKEANQAVFAATGGYTNKNFPVGLTIDQGAIMNVAIKHNMDGLVIISETGELHIFNLDNEILQLPIEGPKIKNPLENLVAFSKLLKWSKANKISLFQSHMFSSNDKIAMSATRSDSRLRERRLLTLCSDIETGKKYHVIFNLTATYTQYEATREVLSIMRNYNKTVEGIINLDTGTFNIMHIYDEQGNVIKQAPNNIKKAANLLVYTI